MKKAVIFLSLLFFFIASTFYLFSSEIKVEDIRAEVAMHFEQPKGGIKFTSEIISNTPVSKLGNDFFKENFLYIDYISRQSEEYMDSITEFFGLYLIAKGQNISDFTEKPKKRFSVHELKATAIRFMFPVKVTKEGKIGTRICVTGEGFRDYSERNIDFEAFTFDAIFNELKKEEDSFLLPRIQEYNKLAVSLKFSTDEQDLLKRAQGFMWAMFYKDKDFEEMLMDCYQRKAKYMPFEIVSE
jgi:hypothetical protein